MAKTTQDIEQTKRLMGALVRMKPRPHEEMKIKKKKEKKEKKKAKRPAREP